MLPPKLILAPTDFSEPSNNAVAVAADLALRFGSELCVAHVVPMLPTLPSMSAVIREGEYEQELHKQAEQRLADEVERLSTQGVSARSVVGTANETAGEILRIAEHNGVDLIVIATA
jgi:nucleotide-binding universal stress UspA family protein